jgi:putative flippase GtrA
MIDKIKNICIKNREIIVYLIVGVLTTIVSLGVYYGLVLTILDPNKALELQIANVISWIAAVTFAYFANRIFVFKSKNKNMLKEGFKFCSSRIFTLLIDMLIMFIMVTLLHLNDKIAKIVVQVIVTILNYIISKFIVFKKNK